MIASLRSSQSDFPPQGPLQNDRFCNGKKSIAKRFRRYMERSLCEAPLQLIVSIGVGFRGTWKEPSQRSKAKRASSTLWAVYKLVMQATHCTPPTSWVLILLTSEGQKAESTLSRLSGIEPGVVSTVLAAVQQFNHCPLAEQHHNDCLMSHSAFVKLKMVARDFCGGKGKLGKQRRLSCCHQRRN